MVGPRLNAAGRLEDMSLGIACLLSDDPNEASKIAEKLDSLNRERRSIEADMQEAALAALDNINPAESSSLAMFDETWHQGVIGILASRLKDKFHRPVIAFARAQAGELKGSGRSIPGLHLRDALDLLCKRHPHLLQKFGGHAMAAGLSIKEEHFAEFQAAFESTAQNLLSPADLTRVIETDGELNETDFTLDIARTLEQQVWGQGFPQPLFEGEFTVESQRVVGEKHLKLRLRHVTDRATSHSTMRANDARQVAGYGVAGRLREQVPGALSRTNISDSTVSGALLATPDDSYDAIRFFSADPMPQRIYAAYKLAINEYNGKSTLQLLIEHWEAVPSTGSGQV